ncbi:uncharacterized protein LOC118198177, partial [Stegodyphus dumicola]|uniref:uncharacterized protein LOC118198177 n=1 Tax=Stegodyphus dumicola TaxID=202533 RepID=UPI0015A95CD4
MANYKNFHLLPTTTTSCSWPCSESEKRCGLETFLSQSLTCRQISALEEAFPKSKDFTTPDVVRYSSPADEVEGFHPPAKFGSWGQLLGSNAKRQQYSSLQATTNGPPLSSAATSTLPRVARQRRQQQQQLYRGARHPAGLSSEDSSEGSASSTSDEQGDEDDDEDNDLGNHSDATTCTGSEMAASRGDQQKDRKIFESDSCTPTHVTSTTTTATPSVKSIPLPAGRSLGHQQDNTSMDPREYRSSCLARTPSGSLFIPS